MISLIVKIVLALVGYVFATLQFIDGNIGNGIFLTLLAGLITLLIFRNEILLWTFWQLRKGDLDKAAGVLNRIKNPKYLVKRQRAYYWYLKGLTTSQSNVYEAEKYFKKSLNMGLKMSHDRAMAKMSLATAAMMRRRKKEATLLLNEAKKLDKHNMLDEQIKMLKQQLKRI